MRSMRVPSSTATASRRPSWLMSAERRCRWPVRGSYSAFGGAPGSPQAQEPARAAITRCVDRRRQTDTTCPLEDRNDIRGDNGQSASEVPLVELGPGAETLGVVSAE